jgi:hypothetical protein
MTIVMMGGKKETKTKVIAENGFDPLPSGL